MNVADRPVCFVLRIQNEYRLFAIKLELEFFRETWTLDKTLAFKRMVSEEEQKEHDSQREAICNIVWAVFAPDDFRGHISGFSRNAEICSIGRDIIIVANQHIARCRIDEKVPVIEILVGITFSVKITEAIAGAMGCRS